MKHSSTRYVGLDIHKECIAVAYVSDEKDAEVLYLGRHRDPPSDIDKLIRGREPWTTAMTSVFVASPRRSEPSCRVPTCG